VALMTADTPPPAPDERVRQLIAQDEIDGTARACHEIVRALYAQWRRIDRARARAG
jgi:hypothetical protein